MITETLSLGAITIRGGGKKNPDLSGWITAGMAIILVTVYYKISSIITFAFVYRAPQASVGPYKTVRIYKRDLPPSLRLSEKKKKRNE